MKAKNDQHGKKSIVSQVSRMRALALSLVACLYSLIITGCTLQLYPDLPPAATETGLGSNYINQVYFSGSNIYAATKSGFSISTDNGQSWKNYTKADGLGKNIYLGVNMFDNNMSGLSVAGGTIYVSTFGGGLAKTNDSGQHWSNYGIPQGLGDYSVGRVFCNGNAVYACTQVGLSISENSGQTWTNYTTANGLGNNYTRDLALNGNTIFVATGYASWSSGWGGLSVSNLANSGFTNYTVSDGLADNEVSCVFATNNSVFVGTAKGLSVATSTAGPWTNYSSLNGSSDSYIRTIYVAGPVIYVGTSSGLFVSNDNCQTWRTITAAEGLGSSQVNSIYAVGAEIICGTSNGVSISDDSGSTWRNQTTDKKTKITAVRLSFIDIL